MKSIRCRICENPLPVDNHGARCAPCVNAYRRTTYQSNKASILARCKRYVRENASEVYQKNRARTVLSIKEKPLIMAFYQARSRAKKRGIAFSIHYSDLPNPPTHCPVFGTPIIYNSGKRTANSPSLDKVIPSLGYIPGNVAIISFRANAIKHDATVEELQKIVTFIKNHAKDGVAYHPKKRR